MPRLHAARSFMHWISRIWLLSPPVHTQLILRLKYKKHSHNNKPENQQKQSLIRYYFLLTICFLGCEPFSLSPPSLADESSGQGNHRHHQDDHHPHLVDIIDLVVILGLFFKLNFFRIFSSNELWPRIKSGWLSWMHQIPSRPSSFFWLRFLNKIVFLSSS